MSFIQHSISSFSTLSSTLNLLKIQRLISEFVDNADETDEDLLIDIHDKHLFNIIVINEFPLAFVHPPRVILFIKCSPPGN